MFQQKPKHQALHVTKQHRDQKQNSLANTCEVFFFFLFLKTRTANTAHKAVCLDMALFSRWHWWHSFLGCPRKRRKTWNTPTHVLLYRTLPVSGVENEVHQCAPACVRVCLWARDRLSANLELVRGARNLSTQCARRRELRYESRSRKYSYYMKTDLLQAEHVLGGYIILEFSSLCTRKVSVKKKNRDLSQGLLNWGGFYPVSLLRRK